MKQTPFSRSPDSEKLMETLIEEMGSQTDRGAAIIGAAWVEEAMTAAIEAYLYPSSKAWDGLFGNYGPMSTFSAKIDLARLLGMVSEVIRADLRIIRDVRNEFAHRIAHKDSQEKLSFKTEHIRSKCLNLRCVEHEEHKDARRAFSRACGTLNSDFKISQWYRTKEAKADDEHIFALVERTRPKKKKWP